jgi:hypothetical protein
MRRKYVFWGFSGRKEAVKARMNEADRVRPTTVRRRHTQLTAAFRVFERIRQVGTKGCDWLQPAEKPGAQGRSERGREDFGLNVAYGLQEGPTLSCQGLVSCHPLRRGVWQRAHLARATVDWSVHNSYFTAKRWGRGKGFGLCDVWRIEAHYSRLI